MAVFTGTIFLGTVVRKLINPNPMSLFLYQTLKFCRNLRLEDDNPEKQKAAKETFIHP